MSKPKSRRQVKAESIRQCAVYLRIAAIGYAEHNNEVSAEHDDATERLERAAVAFALAQMGR